ncbi:hypothetical protein B0E42_11925 [Pseudomonas sp. A25(2017)]|nr:hypothetical protein B0E42_11925 [Pseudomonas sp. A25(2017)]
MWEQGLPAMNALRFFRNRGAFVASKLCSHIAGASSLATGERCPLLVNLLQQPQQLLTLSP